MTDKTTALREAAQSLINGIDTGLVRLDTDADETLANTLSDIRAALSQEDDSTATKCPNPDCVNGGIRTESRSDLGHTDESWEDCPDCTGDQPTDDALRLTR